jgi:hypothetical protein
LKSRLEFKLTQFKDMTFLYPSPVDLENKYLIECPSTEVAKIIQISLSKNFLMSPDLHPSWIKWARTHQDQKTAIYVLVQSELIFSFLPQQSEDRVKADAIQKAMTRKILQASANPHSIEKELLSLLQNQLNCSTCQNLGMNSPEITKWIHELIDALKHKVN